MVNHNELDDFRSVFCKHYTDLVVYAFGILKSRDDAEDVVQEVFTDLWKRRKSLDVKQLRGYLFGSVKNQSLKLLRRKSVRDEHQRTSPFEGTKPISPLDEVQHRELTKQVRDTLDTLPDQSKRIFEMSRIQNKKYQETASELGLSIKTVEAHMSKVLKALRANLRHYALFIALMIML